jgi:hypothetical protein
VMLEVRGKCPATYSVGNANRRNNNSSSAQPRSSSSAAGSVMTRSLLAGATSKPKQTPASSQA